MMFLIGLVSTWVTGRSETPENTRTFLTVFFVCAVVVVYGLHAISRAGYTLSESGLSVGRLLGDRLISYRSITQVERVRRMGSRQGEKVRVNFVRSGEPRVVEITPENPALLIHDLLMRCPHIYKSKNQKTKRDRSFRVAKETLSSPRRKSPPVDY
jgi:hypothetical protein